MGTTAGNGRRPLAQRGTFFFGSSVPSTSLSTPVDYSSPLPTSPSLSPSTVGGRLSIAAETTKENQPANATSSASSPTLSASSEAPPVFIPKSMFSFQFPSSSPSPQPSPSSTIISPFVQLVSGTSNPALGAPSFRAPRLFSDPSLSFATPMPLVTPASRHPSRAMATPTTLRTVRTTRKAATNTGLTNNGTTTTTVAPSSSSTRPVRPSSTSVAGRAARAAIVNGNNNNSNGSGARGSNGLPPGVRTRFTIIIDPPPPEMFTLATQPPSLSDINPVPHFHAHPHDDPHTLYPCDFNITRNQPRVITIFHKLRAKQMAAAASGAAVTAGSIPLLPPLSSLSPESRQAAWQLRDQNYYAPPLLTETPERDKKQLINTNTNDGIIEEKTNLMEEKFNDESALMYGRPISPPGGSWLIGMEDDAAASMAIANSMNHQVVAAAAAAGHMNINGHHRYHYHPGSNNSHPHHVILDDGLDDDDDIDDDAADLADCRAAAASYEMHVSKPAPLSAVFADDYVIRPPAAMGHSHPSPSNHHLPHQQHLLHQQHQQHQHHQSHHGQSVVPHYAYPNNNKFTTAQSISRHGSPTHPSSHHSSPMIPSSAQQAASIYRPHPLPPQFVSHTHGSHNMHIVHTSRPSSATSPTHQHQHPSSHQQVLMQVQPQVITSSRISTTGRSLLRALGTGNNRPSSAPHSPISNNNNMNISTSNSVTHTPHALVPRPPHVQVRQR
jgi:hypothetical protein